MGAVRVSVRVRVRAVRVRVRVRDVRVSVRVRAVRVLGCIKRLMCTLTKVT